MLRQAPGPAWSRTPVNRLWVPKHYWTRARYPGFLLSGLVSLVSSLASFVFVPWVSRFGPRVPRNIWYTYKFFQELKSVNLALHNVVFHNNNLYTTGRLSTAEKRTLFMNLKVPSKREIWQLIWLHQFTLQVLIPSGADGNQKFHLKGEGQGKKHTP